MVKKVEVNFTNLLKAEGLYNVVVVGVQALPCCLDKVPSNPELKWTAQACQRLLDLTPPDTPLLLKVTTWLLPLHSWSIYKTDDTPHV